MIVDYFIIWFIIFFIYFMKFLFLNNMLLKEYKEMNEAIFIIHLQIVRKDMSINY
jgi:hypothetical protein